MHDMKDYSGTFSLVIESLSAVPARRDRDFRLSIPANRRAVTETFGPNV